MRAALLRAPGTLECVEAPTPEPGPGQVLVRTVCASLCGSDLHHVFMPLLDQPFPSHRGFPGHEGVGEVVESRAAPAIRRAGDLRVHRLHSRRGG